MFDADGGRGFGTKPRLMNATKLAEYLGVSTATLRRLVRRDRKFPKLVRLPGVKRDMWDVAAIDRYVDRLRGKGAGRSLDEILFGDEDEFDDPDEILFGSGR